MTYNSVIGLFKEIYGRPLTKMHLCCSAFTSIACACPCHFGAPIDDDGNVSIEWLRNNPNNRPL